jgi:hypothetical protein
MEDANLCMENTMECNEPVYLLKCMEAQMNNEDRLMKEMELLNACTYCENDKEFLLTALASDIDLNVPDPKSQREIDRMSPEKAKRFNDATLNEVKGMKNKHVFENTTMDELPRNTKIYQSIVNWTSKTNLGVYVKTKCRICFGGH